MAGIEHGKLATVVERFYEAAARPELWTEVLAECAEAVGAKGAMLLPGPQARFPPVFTESLAEAVRTGLREGWYDRNPRVLKGLRALRGPEDIITEERLFTPDQIGREPFYTDFVHRFDFAWFAGMVLVDDGPAGVVLSLERDRREGLFERAEVAQLSLFARHFRQAARLAGHMASSHADGLLAGLSMLSCGGVLLDGAGLVIGMNEKAERHLGPGLRLSLRRLAASAPPANVALQQLIGSLLQDVPAHEAPLRAPAVVPRLERRPLIVHGAPIAGSVRDIFRRAKAILMIVDPEEHRDPAEPILHQAFGLTRAECRVATALARGRDAEEIARSSGISEATVRTQIKSILAKTQTRRQAELVMLLNRLAAGSPSADHRD